MDEPTTKRCGKCGATKALGEFAGGQRWCRQCHAAYGKAHYLANPHRYRASRLSARERAKAFVKALKSLPCTDCGRSFPFYVMDLDHIPGRGKVAAVSDIVRNYGERQVREEAAKCEVVCANCHRVRTHERRMAAKAVAPCAQRQSVIP